MTKKVIEKLLAPDRPRRISMSREGLSFYVWHNT